MMDCRLQSDGDGGRSFVRSLSLSLSLCFRAFKIRCTELRLEVYSSLIDLHPSKKKVVAKTTTIPNRAFEFLLYGTSATHDYEEVCIVSLTKCPILRFRLHIMQCFPLTYTQ